MGVAGAPIGFAVTEVLLVINKTTIVSAILACILPIILHTTTILYLIRLELIELLKKENKKKVLSLQ